MEKNFFWFLSFYSFTLVLGLKYIGYPMANKERKLESELVSRVEIEV